MQRIAQLFLRYPRMTLIALIALVYLPFMDVMMLRTTGDEKTYVSQALEMERDGSWFVQTFADQNDYYKGPLHFILLRIGFALFGHEHIFATLYMNFFGLILATLLLHQMFNQALNEPSWALFYAGSFATSITLYSHMFASQMEAELVIGYAVAMALLWRLDSDNRWRIHLLLWSVIALCGWLKSPAHSVFLSISVLLYWMVTSQWQERLKMLKTWWSFIWGVSLGVAGYLPMLLLDAQTFIDSYLIRESLNKGANGVGWTAAVFPLFSYFLAPWMFAFLAAFVMALRTLAQPSWLQLSPVEGRLVRLALALIAPTLLFFTLHPYRGDIYALPAVSASLLLGVVYFRALLHRYPALFIWMLRLSAIVLTLPPLGVLLMAWHFAPMPSWWSATLAPLALFGGAASLVFVFVESTRILRRGPLLLIVAFLPFYGMLGMVLESFGKADMAGLEHYLAQAEGPIGYYNLNHNVWSEYGYLNFWVAHPVTGIHTREKLLSWLEAGHPLIIPGARHLGEFNAITASEFGSKALHVMPWKRWLIHGKAASGERRFLQYWKTKELERIQRDFYIVSRGS